MSETKFIEEEEEGLSSDKTAPAIVLLSGGLDSATVLAIARRNHVHVTSLSFLYGQRHKIEVEAARRLSMHFGAIDHCLIKLPRNNIFFGSALTDEGISVPENRSLEDMSSDIPVTYVPARNTILLSYALALSETVGKSSDEIFIYIGANILDYSGYPDCRPEYLDAFTTMANLGTRLGSNNKGAIKVVAPLLRMSKKDIIITGFKLDVPYELTVSCYQADKEGRACGKCDSCLLRKAGFMEAGLEDPTIYVDSGLKGPYNLPF